MLTSCEHSLAAEWLLKLGGAAELNIPPTGAKWYRNYNGLPWLAETNRGGKPSKVSNLSDHGRSGDSV